MSKYYLAGPMTGYPQFNFPLFTAATAKLRATGWDIIAPHEQDTPAVQAAALASKDGKYIHGEKLGDETWGDMLAKDVKLVADVVKGIIFLPDWHRSRGARLEAFTGLLCDREFYEYRPDALNCVLALSPDWVKARLYV